MQTRIGAPTLTIEKARQEASTVFLAKVFNWMAIGLALTGGIAYLTASTGLALSLVASPMFFVLILAELGMVFYLSARIEKMQPTTATGLFLGYSVLNGLTLSTIFLAYTRTSIAGTFLITAGMFAAMAVYGLVTRKDLSGLGSFLFMGVIGVILASIVNIFLKSPALYWGISMIGVLVFVGLTAYDVQRIKHIGEQGIMAQGEAAIHRGAIIGALALYSISSTCSSCCSAFSVAAATEPHRPGSRPLRGADRVGVAVGVASETGMRFPFFLLDAYKRTLYCPSILLF